MDQEQFTALFRLYISGECTPEQRDLLFDTLQDPAQAEALKPLLDELYEDIRLQAHSPSYVNRWGEIDLLTHPQTPVVPVRSRRRTLAWSAAAAVLVLAAAAGWWMNRSPERNTVAGLKPSIAVGVKTPALAATTDIHTSAKEKRLVVLDDSTRIWLNGGSTLRYPAQFDKNKREVYLEGEAYFDVARAAEWPFVVHAAGGVNTLVLGTSFNIKAYPDHKQLIVSVMTGKVRIERNEQAVSTLVKGQELRLSTVSGQVAQHAFTAEQTTGWQEGDMNFNDEPLADILKDLQLAYGVNITLTNPGLADLLLTTGFKKNTSIERTLSIICELADAKYARRSDGFIVY